MRNVQVFTINYHKISDYSILTREEGDNNGSLCVPLADELLYNPNDDKQNYYFYRLQLELKRLDTQFYEPTKQKLIRVTKAVKPTNK